MPVPTIQEINKKKQDYLKNLAKLDNDGRVSEKYILSSLRSAIRKEWMRNPAKLAALYEAMVPDMNPNTRTKWLFKCAICGNLFKGSDVEVDHIKGEHSFKTIEDFDNYYHNILRVKKDGLQVLCTSDHDLKTIVERYSYTWEEAVSRKVFISKVKQSSAIQKKELQSFGYKGKDTCNQDQRDVLYMKLIEEGKL